MAKSRVDRINELVRERVQDAMQLAALTRYRLGDSNGAETLLKQSEWVSCSSQFHGTYSRLQLADIIRGHKLAWPDA